MPIPLIILGGASGAGKDVVASFIVKNHGAIGIAQSGPMKRFMKKIFNFTDDQLWGPPSSRNAVDVRNLESDWKVYEQNLLKQMQPELGSLGLSWSSDQLLAWFYKSKEYCMANTLTCRYILQTYGTEFGRACDKDVWVNYASRVADTILCGGHTYTEQSGLVPTGDPNRLAAKWVVITDGRFPNELYKVKAKSGFAVKVDGTNTSAAAQAAGVMGHPSETSLESIPLEWYNYIFQNDKSEGLLACEYKVHKLMGLLSSPRYL